MGTRWFVGGSLLLAGGLFAAAISTPRSTTVVKSKAEAGGRATVDRVAALTLEEGRAAPAGKKHRAHPPRFVNEVERVMVEATIAAPAAPPKSDGLELTAAEEQQVTEMRKILLDEITAARGFMTNGNADREKFRAALRAARDEYRANLIATLGKEKADRLRAIVMARGEAAGRRELDSAIRQ